MLMLLGSGLLWARAKAFGWSLGFESWVNLGGLSFLVYPIPQIVVRDPSEKRFLVVEPSQTAFFFYHATGGEYNPG